MNFLKRKDSSYSQSFATLFVLSALSMLMVIGFTGSSHANIPSSGEPIPVVATFSVIGDLVQSIGGLKITLVTFVDHDQDVHDFDPKPKDLIELSRAKLVFMNGLGIDQWMIRLSKSVKPKGSMITLTNGAPLLEKDPHCWHDPDCAVHYVETIKNALIQIRPQERDYFETRAKKLVRSLREMNAQFKTRFSMVSKDRLKVLASHPGLGYLGRAYGVDFVSLPLHDTSRAKDWVNATKRIQIEEIRFAVFENEIRDKGLLQLAKDLNMRTDGPFYFDTLSKSGEASNFLDMIRSNTDKLLALVSKESQINSKPLQTQPLELHEPKRR